MPRRDDAREFLADTDLFFFYLRGGKLEEQAARVIQEAAAGRIVLKTSSEVYDDAITALRSDGYPLSMTFEFVSDMRSIPHVASAMTGQMAADAISMYMKSGGRGRLSYFDSFHIAAAKNLGLSFLTSDRYILRNASKLGIRASDLSAWPLRVVEEDDTARGGPA